MTGAFTAKGGWSGSTTTAANQQAIVNRVAWLLRMADVLQEVAQALKAMFRVEFAVIAHHDAWEYRTMTDTRVVAYMRPHLNLFGNQSRLAVNCRRSGFNSTLESIELDHLLI